MPPVIDLDRAVMPDEIVHSVQGYAGSCWVDSNHLEEVIHKFGIPPELRLCG